MGNLVQDAALRHQRMLAATQALDRTAREAQPPPDERPVFVCAVGWRCGSTLLQRILMTDPSLMVWGEPMDRLGVLDRLADIVGGVTQNWPPAWHYVSHRGPVDLTQDWIANLSPDAADFKAGLRGLLDGWLAAPARRRGFARWGVKEVRWPGDQARLLRWLYPQSRFVVIARHPVQSFHSMRRLDFGENGDGLWVRWPDRQVRDLEGFAAYWNELAVSWAEAAGALGAYVIRYEDLISGRVDFGRLGSALDLELRPEVALHAQAGASPPQHRLTIEERDRVNRLTVEGRGVFQYSD